MAADRSFCIPDCLPRRKEAILTSSPDRNAVSEMMFRIRIGVLAGTTMRFSSSEAIRLETTALKLEGLTTPDWRNVILERPARVP